VNDNIQVQEGDRLIKVNGITNHGIAMFDASAELTEVDWTRKRHFEWRLAT